MKTKLITQIIASLAVLFGLGGLCGYAMSARVHSGRPAWTRSEEWARRWIEHRMAQDFARLEPTPEQQAALRASYDRLLSDFNAIQADASAKVTEAFKRHGADVWRNLTPQQRETLRQTNQERLDRKARQPQKSSGIRFNVSFDRCSFAINPRPVEQAAQYSTERSSTSCFIASPAFSLN